MTWDWTARFATKAFWLSAAEVFDAWRVVPRAVLFSMGGTTIWVIKSVLPWYMHLPATERGVEETAGVVSLVTAISTVFKYALDSYVNSGRKWDGSR